MKDWFLEIWKEGPKVPNKERIPREILRFETPEKAWAYVIEENINTYCVYKAECVVDAS